MLPTLNRVVTKNTDFPCYLSELPLICVSFNSHISTITGTCLVAFLTGENSLDSTGAHVSILQTTHKLLGSDSVGVTSERCH